MIYDILFLNFTIYRSVVHVKTKENVKAVIAGEEAAQIVLIPAASSRHSLMPR